MRSDHAVDEWLPGGVLTRTPVAAEVEGADFTLDGGLASSAPANGYRSPDLARPERDQTTVDLNAIDFEELIALGISVGQAARFISQRGRRGGISSMSELDGFYGLASSVRDILRRSGHV